MNPMKPPTSALRAALLLAALVPLSAAFAADPANPQDAPTPTPTAELRELGAAAAPAGHAADLSNETETMHTGKADDDRVSVLGSVFIAPDEKVNGSAVAVMGSVTVDGTVSEDAVAIMGSNTINGTVHGNVVAVLGNLRLGPKARVDGDVVCVGGRVDRDPSAIVGGKEVVKVVGLGPNVIVDPRVSEWLQHDLPHGRPFSHAAHHPGFWGLIVFAIVLYVLLALAFPGGIRKCGDTLSERPGLTLLTGILGLIALPVLFILVFITIVGIPVAVLILPLAVLGVLLFGKAAIYALVGRSVLGKQGPVVLTVLLGAALFVLLYLVPVLGAALWVVVGFVGFSCALTTLFTPAKAPPAAAGAAAAPVAPVAAADPGAAPSPAPLAESAPPAISAPVAEALPPPLAAVADAGLPRAGFWIRMVALLIDAILVGIVTQMHHLFLPALALYGAVLWKLRGATIGGIIFGLKVVRSDGNPSDWVTMFVRALACFFSLIVVGLGFFWIAFDPEKQAWHDKIAGTVVVRLPKGVSLV